MSVDQLAILRSNPHPTKAFCGEGRSCVINSATLHELIDRESATMPGARSRPAYFEDCRKRPKRQRGKGFFMNRHPIFLRSTALVSRPSRKSSAGCSNCWKEKTNEARAIDERLDVSATLWPLFPGVTPATTLVPYSRIRRVRARPSRPVIPCTRTRFFSSIRIAMRASLRTRDSLGGRAAFVRTAEANPLRKRQLS